MPAKGTLGRLLREQCVLVRIALNVIFDFADNTPVTFLLDWWIGRQYLVHDVRILKSRVLHKVIILLIVKVLLPEAVTMEIMLRIPSRELKAIACVYELIRENCPLATLYLWVKFRPRLVVSVPLERLWAPVKRRIVEWGSALILDFGSKLLLDPHLCWQLHSEMRHGLWFNAISRISNWQTVLSILNYNLSNSIRHLKTCITCCQWMD